MIGGILPNNDMSIFLTEADSENLDSQTVKGTLIRLKDKKRIPLELKKDVEKSDYGLSVEEGDVYRVFIFPRYYSELIELGHIGTRNPLGWGIKIAKEDYACGDSLLKSEMEILKKFGENI